MPKKTISGQFKRVQEYRAKMDSISDHGFDDADELVDTLTAKIAAIEAELESGVELVDDSEPPTQPGS